MPTPGSLDMGLCRRGVPARDDPSVWLCPRSPYRDTPPFGLEKTTRTSKAE